MRIELPVIIESQKVHGGQRVDEGRTRLFRARPLFFDAPVVQDRDLGQAKSKLVAQLVKLLTTESRAGRHREVARYTFSPDLKLHQLKLRLDLRRQTAGGRFPVAVFEHLSRRLAFSPHLPELWFELHRGQSLEARATEVFGEYFRKVERQEGDAELRQALSPFTQPQEMWLEYVDFGVDTAQELRSEQERFLALLGSGQRVEGTTELARVGTCLDHLYPDGLRRFFDGETRVDELDRLLSGKDRAPAMVLGPPLVGKTALIHEAVFRRVERRKRPFARKNNVWLLAPQRLISGMMYVGQWEERLLAILKTAKKRDHVLYFDSLLGLYHAGITSQSTLSVADVLKPYVERGDVRLLAEMTPEAWRVFRERDRGFADLFHLVPLEEPAPEKLLPLLLRVVRGLESKHRCRFEIDVLPTVLELTRRYQRDLANPGKSALVLEQLARKHSGDIARDQVLDDFRDRTGLDSRFLNRLQSLNRQEAVEGLRRWIIGQQAAIDAMADVVMIAKSRLNDPQKPLASLFFLGPTGVGKTESAKALARYLFGNEDRLLRFDMNEFVSADSAARLVGTFDRPDGLLTAAVRQQPFCVVLLDEIEKAHPNVFDILLQILGDARLSDALGRTVDFSNAIVILTSNLGTREAAAQIGFSGDRHQQQEVYLRAVRDFFRPELFNRLDRITPFDPLSREELRQIARKTLADVFAREGFVRRQCTMELLPGVEDWVIDRGYQPSLGARAMKRAVEDHIVRPLAVEIAAMPKDLPVIVSLSCGGNRLVPKAVSLDEAEPMAEAFRPETIADPERALRQTRAVLDRLDGEAAKHRPEGELAAGTVSRGQELYFAFKEAVGEVRREMEAIREGLRSRRDRHAPPAIAPRQPNLARFTAMNWSKPAKRRVLKEVVSAEDVHAYLADLCHEQPSQTPAHPAETRLRSLYESLAWLDAFCPTDGWNVEQMLLVVRGLPGARTAKESLVAELVQCLQGAADAGDRHHDRPAPLIQPLFVKFAASDGSAGWWKLLGDVSDCEHLREKLDLAVIACEGVGTGRLLSRLAGTYLFADESGRLQPAQVVALPLERDGSLDDVLREYMASYDHYVATQDAPPEATPLLTWLPVVALYAAEPNAGYRRVVDFRSGLRAVRSGRIDPWAALVATLPLPAELTVPITKSET